MDPSIFETKNEIPKVVEQIVQVNSCEAMDPGEATWAVPWSLMVRGDEVFLDPNMVHRNQNGGGTVSIKIIKDFDGFFVDATALTKEDIEMNFQENDRAGIMASKNLEPREVGGVLYPLIGSKDSSGLDPEFVKSFNDEQTTTRKKFADYFLKTYGKEYVFAVDEQKRNSRPAINSDHEVESSERTANPVAISAAQTVLRRIKADEARDARQPRIRWLRKRP